MIKIELRAWDTITKQFLYSGYKTFSLFVKRTNCPRFEITQYIGKKDKNDKKIFNGDILLFKLSKYRDTWMGYVEYIKEDCMYVIRFCENDHNLFSTLYLPIEIIGNKFQNPKIIKDILSTE